MLLASYNAAPTPTEDHSFSDFWMAFQRKSPVLSFGKRQNQQGDPPVTLERKGKGAAVSGSDALTLCKS